MAYPTTGSETARPDIAEAFMQMDLEAIQAGMVGLNVLPLREVPYAHGTFPQITNKELLRLPNTGMQSAPGFAGRREPRGDYVRDEFKFEEASFATVEHGFEGVVDENEAAHYRSYLDHVVETARWIRHRLLTQQEIRIANIVFNATTFTGQTTAISTVWTTWATATPVTDIFNARHSLYGAYGIWPDAVVMNRKVYENMINTDEFRARITASGAGDPDRQAIITEDMVKQVLNIDFIDVAQATYDSAAPNSSTFTPAHIWGNDVMVYKRVPAGGSIREAGLGHTFHWSADRSMPNGYVESYREPQSRAEIIRVRHQTQEFIKQKLGWLLTGAAA